VSIEHPTVAASTEPMIVTSRANPDVPDAVIDELLDEGIGPLDYGTDESLDKEEIDASNLSGRDGTNNLVDLCQPYPNGDPDAYEISTRVNNPGKDNPQVIEPLDHEQSGLGEFSS